MPLIQAWKCPKTSKVFEHKHHYLDHLRAEAHCRYRERKWFRFLRHFDDELAELHKCGSEENICRWIEAHSRDLYIRNRPDEASLGTRFRGDIDLGSKYYCPPDDPLALGFRPDFSIHVLRCEVFSCEPIDHRSPVPYEARRLGDLAWEGTIILRLIGFHPEPAKILNNTGLYTEQSYGGGHPDIHFKFWMMACRFPMFSMMKRLAEPLR